MHSDMDAEVILRLLAVVEDHIALAEQRALNEELDSDGRVVVGPRNCSPHRRRLEVLSSAPRG
jgi:hypothetical protein